MRLAVTRQEEEPTCSGTGPRKRAERPSYCAGSAATPMPHSGASQLGGAMPNRLQKVVVITGASGGIGRATALAFAERGSSVVLTARRDGALQHVVRQCQSLGARAIAMAADVTDSAAVEEVAQRAVNAFGRIDVWVNNAAVSLFARFDEAPMDAYRQVIETNLLGTIHGARAALRRFREQGS